MCWCGGERSAADGAEAGDFRAVAVLTCGGRAPRPVGSVPHRGAGAGVELARIPVAEALRGRAEASFSGCRADNGQGTWRWRITELARNIPAGVWDIPAEHCVSGSEWYCTI